MGWAARLNDIAQKAKARLIGPKVKGKKTPAEIRRQATSSRQYVQGKAGRIERRFPKVKGKAAVKAAKRARRLAREKVAR